MQIPVDVIAAFNTVGKIRPAFVRIEDETHELKTYRVEQVELSKEEHMAGNRTITYICNILPEDATQDDAMRTSVRLRFHAETNRWTLTGGRAGDGTVDMAAKLRGYATSS